VQNRSIDGSYGQEITHTRNIASADLTSNAAASFTLMENNLTLKDSGLFKVKVGSTKIS